MKPTSFQWVVAGLFSLAMHVGLGWYAANGLFAVPKASQQSSGDSVLVTLERLPLALRPVQQQDVPNHVPRSTPKVVEPPVKPQPAPVEPTVSPVMSVPVMLHEPIEARSDAQNRMAAKLAVPKNVMAATDGQFKPRPRHAIAQADLALIEPTDLSSVLAQRPDPSPPRPVTKPTVAPRERSERVGKPALGKALADYRTMVFAKVAAAKSYPTIARRLKQQGDVVVTFVIDQQGELKACEIDRPSDFPLLNKAPARLLESITPLPKPPVAPYRITMTFSYRLEN